MAIELNNGVFSVIVTELKPNVAVSIINIDLTIDIKWEEPELSKAPIGNPLKPDFDWEVGSLSDFQEMFDDHKFYHNTMQQPLFLGQGERLDGVCDDTQSSTKKLCPYGKQTPRHPKSNEPPIFPGKSQASWCL